MLVPLARQLIYVENAKETVTLTQTVGVIWYVINVVVLLLDHLVALVPLPLDGITASTPMSFMMEDQLTALQLFPADDAKEIAIAILNVLVVSYVPNVILVTLHHLPVKVPFHSLMRITASNPERLR